MTTIELKTVSKTYRGRKAIDNLSLQVEAGERLVLFGPSGCGKSTILLLIAGLVVPDAGTVLIDGEVVATAGRNRREPHTRGIGMVFQDLALWPHLTVAENIEFGLKAQGIPAGERRTRVQEAANTVGLAANLNTRPGDLSGGEQQRVALARALVLKPRILLMDEPLSSLDEELSRKLRAEILRLHAALRFTLIYVTHSRDEVSELATRTIHAPFSGALK